VTWTYGADLVNSERDQVRAYIQDVDSTRQLLTDEVIDHLLAKYMPAYGDTLWVASVSCIMLAARFTPEVNASADGMNVDQGSLADKYRALAADLREQYRELYANTGVIVAEDPFGLDFDPSLEALNFGIGFQDNHWAGKQDYGARPGGVGLPIELDPRQW